MESLRFFIHSFSQKKLRNVQKIFWYPRSFLFESIFFEHILTRIEQNWLPLFKVFKFLNGLNNNNIKTVFLSLCVLRCLRWNFLGNGRIRIYSYVSACGSCVSYKNSSICLYVCFLFFKSDSFCTHDSGEDCLSMIWWFRNILFLSSQFFLINSKRSFTLTHT